MPQPLPTRNHSIKDLPIRAFRPVYGLYLRFEGNFALSIIH